MKDKYFAYVGVKPCGCKVAATVISPQWTKETAKTVAEWINRGYTVEQVECSEENPVPIKRCECSEAGMTEALAA